MEADHADLIAKFAGVTGVDAERAEFYLQSSGWMLDVSLRKSFSWKEVLFQNKSKLESGCFHHFKI